MSKTRALGLSEVENHIFHKEFNCSTMCLLVIRLKGPLEPGMLKQALQKVSLQNVMLQATHIEESENAFSFQFEKEMNPASQQFDDIPFFVVKRESDHHWTRVAEQEMHKDFDKYLWRTTFLHSEGKDEHHEILMVFHHSITDGVSFSGFANDLLTYCDELSKGNSKPKLKSLIPLLPPVEDLLFKPGEKLDEKDSTDQEEPSLTAWPFQAFEELPKRRTRHIFRVIDQETLLAVRTKAKSENASINGALTASLLLASSDALNIDRAEKQQALVGSAVNLRNFCEPPISPDYFGCFANMVFTTHPIHESLSFWDVARQCHEEVKNEINTRHAQGFLDADFDKNSLAASMIKEVSDMNQTREFAVGPCISNLGVLKFPEKYGPFELKEMYFNTTQVSAHFMCYLYLITLHNKAYFSLSYTFPLISEKSAEAIADNFLAMLEHET